MPALETGSDFFPTTLKTTSRLNFVPPNES